MAGKPTGTVMRYVLLAALAALSVGGGLVFAAQATSAAASQALTSPQNAAAIAGLTGASASPPPLDAAQVARGAQVYAEYCARCHGAKLEGQPNWRLPTIEGKYPAPPHSEAGHTWQHGDPVLLADIMDGVGGANSEMKGFRGILSGPDQVAALQYIKSTWPPETRAYQWRMTLIHHLWGGTGH